MSLIKEYLNQCDEISDFMVATLASLKSVAATSPQTARSIVNEIKNQREHLKLIASENYASPSTLLAMGNLLTDKYAEGIPGHRHYAGCENVDSVEEEARRLACELFGAEHAYAQPHSGADANMIAFWAVLSKRVEAPALSRFNVTDPSKLSLEDWRRVREELGNQRILGLDLYSGGHLTHGFRQNVSGRMFEAHSYSINEETGTPDYDEIRSLSKEIKPLLIIAGYSACSGLIDFKAMRDIADESGAVLMVDMAHFAGLVAGKVLTGVHNPVPYADIVTTTTHKTLRGPRGGLILCRNEFSEAVDKGCPFVIGGPLPHMMAAKAVAFREALSPEFREYSARVVENSKALAAGCISNDIPVATGGTENHLFLMDLRSFPANGRQCETAMVDNGVILNRNSLKNDPEGAWYTSGLRVGTPAVTTRGMGKAEMSEIAEILAMIVKNAVPAKIESGKRAGEASRVKYDLDAAIAADAQRRVSALLERFPLYPELDIKWLEKAVGV